MFLLLILLGLPIIVGLAVWLAIRNASSPESFCPHGYEDFACQPSCPLYEHCYGNRE